MRSIKIFPLAAALALSAGACAAQQGSAAQPEPAQPGVESCRDSVTGSPAMPVQVMRETEQHYWPELPEREAYRLTMLQERLGAYLREGRPFPTRLDEFA